MADVIDLSSETQDDGLQQELFEIEQELSAIEDQVDTLLQRQAELEKHRQKILGALMLAPVASNSLKKKEKKKEYEESKPTRNWSGDDFPWSKKLKELMHNIFGATSFRYHQKEVLNATLSGKDVFVIMPTGSGKSLCYQLPALIDTGLTVVISPLLALIVDQVYSMREINVSADMLTSALSKEETQEVLQKMDQIAKNPSAPSPLKLLYVTPERIGKSKRFLSKLQKIYECGKLSRIVVDEAHCCSQWGHDFRTDYKTVGLLKQQFPQVPMLALTATATKRVSMDVKNMLRIPNCEIFRSTFNRSNLHYEVREKPAKAQDVISDIAEFIKDRFYHQSGIIYCYSRKETESVAIGLQDLGIKVACYHAQNTHEERMRVQRKWANNEIHVICATIAFGMGINKPDVRFVIHHTLPKSIEGFLQESGRAGRDSLPSHSIVYFRNADCSRQSTMVFGDGQNRGLPSLYAMIRFCINNKTCRRVMMGQYLGETLTTQDCNKHCDFCSNPKKLKQVDITSHAKVVLQICNHLAQNGKKATLLQLIEMMRGGGKQKTLGLHFTPIKDLSKEECEKVLNWLLMEDILQEDFHWTAYSTISYLVRGEKAYLVDSNKILMDFVEEEKKKRKRNTTSTKKTKKAKEKEEEEEEEEGEEEEEFFDYDFGDDFAGGESVQEGKGKEKEEKEKEKEGKGKEKAKGEEDGKGRGKREEKGKAKEEVVVESSEEEEEAVKKKKRARKTVVVDSDDDFVD